jgi:hypothetical protein
MFGKKRELFVWVAALAVAGCGTGAGTGTAEFTVRDSAGVRITEHGVGAAPADWRLSEEPVLEIGVFEGEPEYQLYEARGAVRLADGTIVVVNAGTGELRFYGPRGEFIRAVGGEGGGPGEFQQLGWVRRYGEDSLLAYDFGLQRVTVFDRRGEMGRMYSINPPGELGFVIGFDAFRDGTLLAKAPLIFQGGFSDGLTVRDEVYLTFSPSGVPVDSIGTFLGPEQWVETGRSGGDFFVAVTQPPFGRVAELAAFDDEFCFGSGDPYEISCYGSDGTLRGLIRREVAQRVVTDADVAALKQRDLDDAEDDAARRRVEQRYSEMPVPGTMPVFDDVEFDDRGNLWVRDYDPNPDAERRWTVFDGEGRMIAGITVPPGLGVMQVGDDFLLALWRDELDVEHVRMFDLTRQ